MVELLNILTVTRNKKYSASYNRDYKYDITNICMCLKTQTILQHSGELTESQYEHSATKP